MQYLHWEGEREREGGGGGVGEMVRVRKSGRVFVNRMMSIYCKRDIIHSHCNLNFYCLIVFLYQYKLLK